jgi:putative transposase
MTHAERAEVIRLDIDERIREGVKAVLEEVMEEEMNEHLQARHRERTEARRGHRNGHYTRGLLTPTGQIEQLQVPRDREGEFLTEAFERYQRMTGSMEEAILEMYLQGVSTRKVAAITEGLAKVKVGKDAVSRIAGRLTEQVSTWCSSPLTLAYPYVYLDAIYLKVNWGGRVGDLALLVAMGVNEQGHREVLAVEAAGGERKEAYQNLLRGLLDRGLQGVKLVISDDHESIKQAVVTELPRVKWQRCVVHFERNILSHVPRQEAGEMAADLRAIFGLSREETVRTLATAFSERWRKRFGSAVKVFERGLDGALTYLQFPTSHHRLIRTTNPLERLNRETKRRTRVVGIFPSEQSALNLATTVMLRASEDWALRKYLDMAPLEAMEANTQD